MRLKLNGEAIESGAPTMAALIGEQDYDPMVVATALNGEFVPRDRRAETTLAEGDSVEVFSPRQGG